MSVPVYFKLDTKSVRFADYREGDDNTLILYTDGGSRPSHNGIMGRGNQSESTCSVAGAGIYLANDGSCYTAPIPGGQTNNRAELTAMWVGMLLAQEHLNKPDSKYTKAVIKTDSSYSISVFTEYISSWRRSPRNVPNEVVSETTVPWRRSSGDIVLNQDLIHPIHKLFVSLGKRLELQKVNAHKGTEGKGNENADELALISIKETLKKKNLPLGPISVSSAGKKKHYPPKKNIKLKLGFQ